MKKITILICLCLFVINSLFSQIDGNRFSNKGLLIYFDFMYVQSSIKNNFTNLSNNENNDSKQNWYSAKIGYSFSKYFGINTGLGYSSYSSEFILKTYTTNFETSDSENDLFVMNVNGNNIKERQTIYSIDIPFLLLFKIPFNHRFGIEFSIGAKYLYPIKKSFKAEGVFSYIGYYPKYNVTLYNIPEYGFGNDINLQKKGDLFISSFNYAMVSSSGFYFRINPKIKFYCGLYYDRLINNLSLYDNDYKISKQQDEYNSLLYYSSNTILQAYGVKVSLIFLLKKR